MAAALGMSAGHTGAVMRGSAPLTNPAAWANALGIGEQQLLRGRRQLPTRRDHYSQAISPTKAGNTPVEPSPHLAAWQTAVESLSDSLDSPLSGRQSEVLIMLCGSLTLAEITDELSVSVATVRTHIRGLYSRMGPLIVSRATARAAVIGHLDPAHRTIRAEMAGQLTARQLEVLTRTNAGARVSAIASELGLSETTVNRHLKMSYGQLGVHTLPQALAALFGGPAGA
ncbi:LuxR C-terminal-related transcriptional regulator [Solicola sp. PLA-1-18]|uniref:LuxR C-terminal-related transcriptional regulator n=1 Tax=Solicola sp. PLA-1-18 TaxID=3380532 RepID=UPI003B7A1DBD